MGKLALFLAVASLINNGLFSLSTTNTIEADVPPIEPETENRIYLKERLKQEGLLTDYPIFNTIIQLESNWNEKAVNKTSGASGLGQFLHSSWARYGCQGNILNGKDNIDCMIKAYKLHWIAPWCSDVNMFFALKKRGIYCKPEWIDSRSYKN